MDSDKVRQFMEVYAHNEDFIDHDVEECGLCCNRAIMGEVSREFLDAGNLDFVALHEEITRRWQDTKFFKLWQEERAAGRDPEVAFAQRGWEA